MNFTQEQRYIFVVVKFKKTKHEFHTRAKIRNH